MKIAVFIVSTILADGVVAAPIRSSSLSENYEIQKHEIEDLPPISIFVTPGGFIEPIPACSQETTATCLPFDSRPDNLKDFPTIVDDIPGEEPMNQTNITVSSKHGGRPESRVTKDVTQRYGEELRSLCYQLDGSPHRQESCAREVKAKGNAQHPSWNVTAGLGKRAVSKDASDSVSVPQTTETNCSGASCWEPAEQFSDLSGGALATQIINHPNSNNNPKRRQDYDPDPAWMDKYFINPQVDNSIKKRDGGNWQFELSMEFEDPKTHATTDVDVEANWFSDWKRDISEQVKKLEHEIKNGTEDATDAVQDNVERFVARVMKHNSHTPGKLNLTAIFDQSQYHKRGLSESVKKVEDDISGKLREGYKYLTAPNIGIKNSTFDAIGVQLVPVKSNSTARFNTSEHYEQGLPESVMKPENKIGSEILKSYNEVTKPFTERRDHTERRLHRSAHKTNNLTTQHHNGRDASPPTVKEDHDLSFAETMNSTNIRDFLHKFFSNQISGKHNYTSCSQHSSDYQEATGRASHFTCGGTSCPRSHPREFKRSFAQEIANCHKYGSKTPNEEFSRENSELIFTKYANYQHQKHKIDQTPRPKDGQGGWSCEEEKQVMEQIEAEINKLETDWIEANAKSLEEPETVKTCQGMECWQRKHWREVS